MPETRDGGEGFGRALPRRRLLALTGGLAASLLARSVGAQTYTATSISQAAQDARREAGKLGRRADLLLRAVVADGPGHSARAVRRFRGEEAGLARSLAALFNTRVSEDDWLLVVPTRELDLVLAMRPLVLRIVPTASEVEAALKEPLAQVEPLTGDDADDVLHTLVLTVLGLERRVALFEQLRNDRIIKDALKDAAAAIRAERFGLAALELERLMRAMVRPETVAAIRDNLGPEAPRTLYKKLVVRFVPFIGWTDFTALLLTTIYFNRDTSALQLR